MAAVSGVEDLGELPLSCEQVRAGSKAKAACSGADDCQSRMCLLAGACASPCADDADCAAGERCQAVYARVPAGFARGSACVDRVNLPADVEVVSELRASAVSGGVDSLELPPSAARTLFVLEHMGDDSWPVPSSSSRCRPPLCARKLAAGEHTLFALDALADLKDGPDNPVAQGNYVNPLTLLIPNGPRAQPSGDGYQLELESKRPGALRLTRLSRRSSGQRLDLNLFYVGARGLVPDGARGVPRLEAALEELERILEPAEIYLGEVRQVLVQGELLRRGTPLPNAEVSAGFQTLLSQYQVLPQLPELFRLSAGAANRALNVFFIADIDSRGSGGDVGAIAGGTPVPLGMHGTPGSGIVVAADMFLDDADATELGRTLAHELGHALGLFHTTEVDGLVFDPLPDTPVCTLASDRSRDGALDALECAADGGDNLMFPTSDTEGTTLTPQQIEVLRSALILQ